LDAFKISSLKYVKNSDAYGLVPQWKHNTEITFINQA